MTNKDMIKSRVDRINRRLASIETQIRYERFKGKRLGLDTSTHGSMGLYFTDSQKPDCAYRSIAAQCSVHEMNKVLLGIEAMIEMMD